jgi:8-oxo-dGTP diphosphatase
MSGESNELKLVRSASVITTNQALPIGGAFFDADRAAVAKARKYGPDGIRIILCGMRTRLSARLLVLDPSLRVLLFRFVHSKGALAGQDYWATPGGGVEEGETFEQAAIRELEEETGICVQDIGAEIGRREFVLQLPDGEHVISHERFFLVRTDHESLSRDGWTAQEAEVMTDHKWWSCDELAQTTATVWPEDLLSMLKAVMAG